MAVTPTYLQITKIHFIYLKKTEKINKSFKYQY